MTYGSMFVPDFRVVLILHYSNGIFAKDARASMYTWRSTCVLHTQLFFKQTVRCVCVQHDNLPLQDMHIVPIDDCLG